MLRKQHAEQLREENGDLSSKKWIPRQKDSILQRPFCRFRTTRDLCKLTLLNFRRRLQFRSKEAKRMKLFEDVRNDFLDRLDTYVPADCSCYLGDFLILHDVGHWMHVGTDPRELGSNIARKGSGRNFAD
jgi:hypothetical protein